jgi:ACT domain-containing protein
MSKPFVNLRLSGPVKNLFLLCFIFSISGCLDTDGEIQGTSTDSSNETGIETEIKPEDILPGILNPNVMIGEVTQLPGLVGSGCSANEILEWSGSDWMCVPTPSVLGGAATTVPASGIQAGPVPAGVTMPANQVTGTLNPSTQMGAGALNSATTVASTQITSACASNQILQANGSGNFVCANLPSAPSAPVTSVYGRVGFITAQAGDYASNLITNTPAGNISATNLQNAVNELDSEKLSTSGGTVTGMINMSTNVISNLGAPVNPNDAATKSYIDLAIAGTGSGTVTSITGGSGLSGGAITSSGTLAVDIQGTADLVGAVENADSILMYDDSTSSLVEIIRSEFVLSETEVDAFVNNNGYLTTAPVNSVFGRTGVITQVAGDYTGTQITNTAAGNIVATNIQAAINELDSEKLALSGGAITGNITMGSNEITGLPANPSVNSAAASKAYVDAQVIASGSGTVTNVSAGTGLTGGPVTTTGTIGIANQGVDTLQIANDAVTTTQIDDLTILNADVANNSLDATTKLRTSCTNNQILMSDGSNNLVCANIPSSSVTSVYGRTGIIVAMDDDYTSNQINNTPAGNIVATDVQAAINELDSEKLNLAGGTMSGALNMGTNVINNVGTPVAGTDATTKAYVDTAVAGTSSGTVTSVAAGTGLTGGPVTTTGTIGIANQGVDTLQIANDAVTTTQIENGTITNDDIQANTIIATQKLTSACTNNQILQSDGAGNFVCANQGSAPVASVYGRTGVILAMDDDYTASQVNNTAAGDISATDVQAAINELDSEKLNTTGGTITGAVSMSSNAITNLPAPSSGGDAANKAYVDSVAGGAGDDLGDHEATSNIDLGSNYISGDGDSEGVFVHPNGDVSLSNGIQIGSTTSLCDVTTEGMIRYNSTLKRMEFCNATDWKNISSGVIANLSLSAPSSALVQTGPVDYVVTYGSGVDSATITLNSGDITVAGSDPTNCVVTGVIGGGLTRTVTVDGCTGTGSVNISIAPGTASSTTGDPAGAAGPSASYNADNTGPSVPAGISLGAVPRNTSNSPTITYSAASDTGGSTVANHQVRIEKTSDASLILDWMNHSSGSDVGSLSLEVSTEYTVYVRAVDALGNEGSASAGNNWTTVSGACLGSPSPGAVCAGGAIYLGNLSADKYMTTPGGCADIPPGDVSGGSGATSYALVDFTVTCSGTDSLTKTWNNGTSNWYDIPGLTNYTTTAGTGNGATNVDVNYGSANTVNIAVIRAGAQGGYHAAARYCDRLVYGGYNDWHLANRFELNLMYTNRASIPGLDLSGNWYWSSTEYNTIGGWIQRFSDGNQNRYASKSSSHRVRCVRRF